MTARPLWTSLVCLLLAGCAVGPDYKRPKMVTPEAWRDSGPAVEDTIANVPWWELFKDEQLRALITVALQENKDLKIAIERIEEARANAGIAKADYYPQLSLHAAAGGLNGSNSGLLHTPGGSGDDDGKAYFNVGLGLSWELDFFGRVRRASEAQKALLMASEEGRRAVAISLVSDVALAYMDLRALDRLLDISRSTLVTRKEHVEFSRNRFEGHVANEVDLRQAEAEQFRIEAVVFDYERQVAQKENEISVLIGRNPAAIVRNRSAEDQPVPPEVPAGLPAKLLERRPDVRKAEMELWSSTARIGEAKAMLYPSISLTGNFGFASTDLGSIADPGSQTWNIFAQLLQPIFEGGRNTARVEMRESQQRQTLYAYESTLLNALREVEDSLVGLRQVGKQKASLTERVNAAQKVVDLAELRYKGGVSTYLEVLDAQRTLFDAQTSETNAKSEHIKFLIRLYKALGGGWPADQATGPTAPPGAPAPAGPAPAAPPNSKG